MQRRTKKKKKQKQKTQTGKKSDGTVINFCERFANGVILIVFCAYIHEPERQTMLFIFTPETKAQENND